MSKTTANNLTIGEPGCIILRFSIPILLASLLQQLYSMLDTIIIGQLLGKTALAGVGSTGSINFLVVGFCMGLCYGFVIPIAQRFGAGDYTGLRKFIANSFWVGLVIAVFLTIVICIFCKRILIFMQTPKDILNLAYPYIFIIFAGIPITCAYNLLAGIIRSLGDSKTPLIFLLISSVVNVGFDILSIKVLGMGVQGPAFATLLAQGFSALLCFIFLKKHFGFLRIQKGEWKFEPHYARTLCTMGIPMGLQYSITAIGSVILQIGVNGLGSDVVAAVSAANKLNLFLSCPTDALGTCMATYAGQNVGAGKVKRIRQGYIAAVRIGIIYSVALFILMLFTAQYWILLFIKPEETIILSHAVLFIRITSAFYVLLTFVNVTRPTIQGVGCSGLAMCAGVMEMIARSIIGIALIPAFGFISSAFASPLAWLLADCFLIPAYFHVMKQLSAKLKQTKGLS